MRRLLREEAGIALVSAIALLGAMLGLGLGVVAMADSESHQSRQQRTRESSFTLAEAALNAVTFQLNQTWPAAAVGPCSSTSTGAGCPASSEISNGLTSADYGANPGPCAQPLWKAQVHDDVTGSYYDSTVLDSTVTPVASYDANGDGLVWVRATAAAQCHVQTVVSLVSRALTPMDFPRDVLVAGWFKTGNNGNKVIVNTQGSAPQGADLKVRCKSPPAGFNCLAYRQPGQVSPDTARIDTSMSNQTLDATQLNQLRQQAKQAGTYFGVSAAGTPICPSNLSSSQTPPFAGAPVFVEGPCTLSGGANDALHPGLLIINNGSYTIGANRAFYGLIYALNAQGWGYADPPVVSSGGCGQIYGAVVVDGLGGVNIGQCKSNLVFDPHVFDLLHSFGGATLVKDSWRVLPAGQ